MTKKRFILRLDDSQPRGKPRWIVWDTYLIGWADAAHITKRSAQQVCDELNLNTPTPFSSKESQR